MTVFNAATLARGWLSVAIASSSDKQRPALHKTVSIESYHEGIRVVATDSYILLHSWIPNIENEFEPEPELDEAPYARAIAIDPHGRGKGFLAHANRLAAASDDEPVEVRLNLGVVDEIEQKERMAFAGLEARYVVLEMPDMERIKLSTYEGDYPSWRPMVAGFTSEATPTVALSPDIIGRLAKLGKIHVGAMLGWEFGGDKRAARLTAIGADPTLEGLIMPVRWDFDTGAERIDEPVGDEDEGDEGTGEDPF